MGLSFYTTVSAVYKSEKYWCTKRWCNDHRLMFSLGRAFKILTTCVHLTIMSIFATDMSLLKPHSTGYQSVIWIRCSTDGQEEMQNDLEAINMKRKSLRQQNTTRSVFCWKCDPHCVWMWVWQAVALLSFPVTPLNLSTVYTTEVYQITFTPWEKQRGNEAYRERERERGLCSWVRRVWSYQCSPRHLFLHHQCTQTGTPAGTGRTSGRLQKDL